MSASKKMGRNPFERKASASVAPQGAEARPTAAAAAAGASATTRSTPSWAERIEAAHAEAAASCSVAGKIERAAEWALVDVPASAFLFALKNVLKFRD